MKVSVTDRIRKIVEECVELGETVKVTDPVAFRGDTIDCLVHTAVFGDSPEDRGSARWVIKSAGVDLGVYSASIQGLYEAMGRGEAGGYSVPAINIRGMTYDVAASIFRTAIKNDSGTFIFEIAKSEIAYTYQRPAEYTVVILAAAIKTAYKGPVFIQGDHFQVNAKKHKDDPAKEVQGVRDLISEAVKAGFYNIDIDTSTLVDLSKGSLSEQQRLNYEVGAELTLHVRTHEPSGITVSVGGEIGEVGEKNSTVEELVAYMEGYNAAMNGKGVGISKVSVQTGTSHGGVPLPDGSVAEVALDFDTLEKLSKTAKEMFGLSGAVQHGASTLPDELFHRFPETGTSEIHLATGFQNMIYDSSHLPSDLRDKVYAGLNEQFASERSEGQTDEQFIYKVRKKGFGLAKREFWELPETAKNGICGELEGKFDFLFKKLGVAGNKGDVEKYITHVPAPVSLEEEIDGA